MIPLFTFTNVWTRYVPTHFMIRWRANRRTHLCLNTKWGLKATVDMIFINLCKLYCPWSWGRNHHGKYICMSPLYCCRFAHICPGLFDIRRHLTVTECAVKCVLVYYMWAEYRNYLYIHCPPAWNLSCKSICKIHLCFHSPQIESMYNHLRCIHYDLHQQGHEVVEYMFP